MDREINKELPTRITLAILAVLIIAQAALTLGSFRGAADITNKEPVINVDFGSQYYWAYAAREFRKAKKNIWGYDPFFMAGYPLDFVFNSSLPVQLAAVAFAKADLARLIKACFIISFILVPLVMYGSMRLFELGRGGALAAAGLGLVHFWTAENALFGRFGMIAGAFELAYFLLPLGLLYRFLRYREHRAFSLLIFALPLAFTIHKTAFVLVLPMALLWIMLFSTSLRGREWIMVAGVFVFAGIVNLHWLYPFFKFLPLKIEDAATTFFQNDDLFRWIKDLCPGQEFFAIPATRVIIVAAGTFGLLKMKNNDRPLFLCLLGALGFFGALTYFGSQAPELRHLQPYRYVTAYFYTWLPAAGVGLVALHKRVSALRGGAVAGPVAFALVLVTLMFMPSFRYFNKVAPLTTEMDMPSRDLIAWVRENTDRSARLLIEDVNAWEGQGPAIYGGGRIVHMLPALVARELVGGPLPNAFILHHHAGFHDSLLLDRPIEQYSDGDLAEAMRLYNIGWVACWSEAGKARLRAYPGAKFSAEFGYLEVFTLERGHDFFLFGKGKASADWNRIELSGLSTSEGRLVISYHWVDGLKSRPAATLKKAMIGDDPAGFIEIIDPPPGLVISLGS